MIEKIQMSYSHNMPTFSVLLALMSFHSFDINSTWTVWTGIKPGFISARKTEKGKKLETKLETLEVFILLNLLIYCNLFLMNSLFSNL